MAQYAYLYQLSQLLNLSEAQLAAAETALKTVSAEKAGQKDLSRQAQNLKALILKSADTVERRMDELRTELSGSYVAQSDFGAYVEQLSLYLEANPEALTQYYRFAAEMQGELSRVDAAFQEYRTETGGYIRTGHRGLRGGRHAHLRRGRGAGSHGPGGGRGDGGGGAPFPLHLHRLPPQLLAGRDGGGLHLRQPPST